MPNNFSGMALVLFHFNSSPEIIVKPSLPQFDKEPALQLALLNMTNPQSATALFPSKHMVYANPSRIISGIAAMVERFEVCQ